MSNHDELPPLPPPGLLAGPLERREWYSAEQMHAYARAARAQVWREAGALCEEERVTVCSDEDVAYNAAIDHCVTALRARAEKKQK